ncbi:MAG TPA: hypothetical protein VEV39_07355 [Gemmatimonadales bacterium]|nr:hypothetical protein [Gemmatimonadales bacterium]
MRVLALSITAVLVLTHGVASQDRAPRVAPLVSTLTRSGAVQPARPVYARMLTAAPVLCYAPGNPGTPDLIIPGIPATPPVGDFPGVPGTPTIVIQGNPETPGYFYPCD